MWQRCLTFAAFQAVRQRALQCHQHETLAGTSMLDSALFIAAILSVIAAFALILGPM
jgi:hypothetical protein